MARTILYPDYLRRSCVEALSRQGAMGLGAISQGRLFADAVQRVHGREVVVEAYGFGQAIHTAHVLRATYIPHTPHDSYVGTWIEPMSLMGDHLNFYRSLNGRIAAAWAESERGRREKRTPVLPPVPIVEFDPNAPIDDVLAFTSISSTRRKGRSLIGRLAALPHDERVGEIERLRKDLYQLGGRQSRRGQAFGLLDAATSVADFAAGAGLFPFVAAWRLVEKLIDLGRRNPQVDAFIDELDGQLRGAKRNEDLEFLSKVSRVATLRRER